jgi:putative DNA primase/helicase
MPDNIIDFVADKEKGLLHKGKRVSDYIEVIALSRDATGSRWKKRILFRNMDGKESSIDIEQKTLCNQKEVIEILFENGLDTSCDRQKLMMYLVSAKPKKRITDIYTVGWIGNDSFVCPSFSISKSGESSFSLVGNIKTFGFAKKGSLEEWKENVCTLCEGNKILTLALCIGLSGVLLKRLKHFSTAIINLVGRSSIGKTTVLRIAASMWGEPKNFIQQWRSTSNALEAVAESHNDCLLILDELGQVQSKDVGNIVYMLGNSKGKSRMNADSELKKSKEWTLSILSSGETGIADKTAESREKVKAGQLVRFIDIDCLMSDEGGIYDTLHDDISNGAEFSKLMNKKTSEYYGMVAEAFILGMTEKNTDVKSRFSLLKREFEEKMRLEKADGQVHRVADLFILYALAGELACELKIFSHRSNELKDMIFELFKKWLEERGGTSSMEESTVLQHVIGFLEQNNARFQNIISSSDGKKPEEPRGYNNSLGFRETTTQNDKETVIYYIIPKSFNDNICEGMNKKLVKRILNDKGILILDSEGKNPKCPYTVPKNNRRVKLVLIFQ